MKKTKMIVFDLDGTVLDTLPDLTDATNAVLTAKGFAARETDEVRRFVGNGYHRLMEQAAPIGTTPAIIDELTQAFTKYYNSHCTLKTAPYPGVPEMLAALRAAGIRTALISNKGDAAVHAVCEYYFPGLFDSVAGERPGIPRKPDPTALFSLLREAGIRPDEAVFVGDSEVDVATAQNAGVPGAFVSFGFRPREVLLAAGAKHIFDTVSALSAFLLSKK
ncbi:MAG: HAD-IA family hydrolase [Clostridia bacterium]|nr:HAD-IA family hydrolase [Clostridia bacterium]MDY2826764.1 HAD-IA family hydrolase [Eubacteriales bacterium]